jgi:N,N'-diacetyllegionaminate synthase
MKNAMETTSRIAVGSALVGTGCPVFIIAEAGVNHNGDVGMAIQLVEQARRAGADCVKFQTFRAEKVATASAPKAEYQLHTTPPEESQLAMLRKLELPVDAYPAIINRCKELGILFMSTPYGPDDVELLASFDVPAYKVASGQIVEHALLEQIARKGKPIFLSTGMATLSEVDEAVRCIRRAGNQAVILLQCTTNYPSRPADANLRAMTTMQQSCQTLVGYSDHTQTNTACIAAVAMGACTIEKHFTLDKGLPGPDHSTSCTPDEFTALVSTIRECEIVRGTGLKEPSPVEVENAKGMRRSIVAARPLKAGTVITPDVIAFKRPASGISPRLLPELLGKTLRVDVAADHLLTWSELF